MRFEVPQFIEVEDKIIGPFTWKQFVYLAGGGGAAVILFFMLPFILFALFAIPIVALAGFLSFHQINNRPFAEFLEAGVNYFSKTKLYLWRKQHQQTILSKNPLPQTVEQDPVATAPHLPKPESNNIASLSRQLELEALDLTDAPQR